MEIDGGTMHKCVRCGRAATSLQEINDGCPCGSKVFVFNKDAVSEGSIAGESVAPKEVKIVSVPVSGTEPDWDRVRAEANASDGNGKSADAGGADGNGKLPESYRARMTFSTEDVENIKVLTEGVFALELKSLYHDPVVLKDEEGIYYVKIPFEQNVNALKEFGKKKGNGKQADGKKD